MNLRQLRYMDLGHNNIGGSIPSDWGMDFIRLDVLHLDHNKFTGSVPETITATGNHRVEVLSLDNNAFTGTLPGNHEVTTLLVQFTAHNNNFNAMNEDTCDLSVFHSGELVEFKIACDICQCNDFMCDFCTDS